MNEPEPKFLVSLGLLNRIAQILAREPYDKVFGVMNDLQKLEPYKEEVVSAQSNERSQVNP